MNTHNKPIKAKHVLSILGRRKIHYALNAPAVFGLKQLEYISINIAISQALYKFVGVKFDSRAHGGSDNAGLDILTLYCGRFCLDDCAH